MANNNHYHGEEPSACPECGHVRRHVQATVSYESTIERYNCCCACGSEYKSYQSCEQALTVDTGFADAVNGV